MGLEVDGKRGVMNHYGPRKSSAPVVGGQTGVFNTKFAEWVFDHDDLPTPTSDNDMQYIIPAGSLIIGATWQNITAGAGGSGAYTVGLNGTNNETVDADGVFTAAQIDNTLRGKAATAIGSGIKGAGAQIGTVVGVDSKVAVAGGASSTAGRFKVVIEYQPNAADGVGSK